MRKKIELALRRLPPPIRALSLDAEPVPIALRIAMMRDAPTLPRGCIDPAGRIALGDSLLVAADDDGARTAHAAAIAAERDAPQVVSQAALQSTADERRERSSGALCCAVCLDKAVNTALTPCFHAKFCNGCAVTIAFNRLPCPICRGQVNGLQRIYL